MTTLVTAAQINEIRRMVAEPTATTYNDALIVAFIEKYPLLDELGEEPFDWLATVPPTTTANTEWIPTYDLNAAAADILDEKATTVMSNYDFSADGGNYSRSQQFEMYSKQARHYRSRRSIGTFKAVKYPEEPYADRDDLVIKVDNLYGPEP
jgi:hypothetical protein